MFLKKNARHLSAIGRGLTLVCLCRAEGIDHERAHENIVVELGLPMGARQLLSQR